MLPCLSCYHCVQILQNLDCITGACQTESTQLLHAVAGAQPDARTSKAKVPLLTLTVRSDMPPGLPSGCGLQERGHTLL